MKISYLHYAAGQRLPHGWGIAWHNYYDNSSTVLPVPLNAIVYWVMRAYYKVRSGIRPHELPALRAEIRELREQLDEIRDTWLPREMSSEIAELVLGEYEKMVLEKKAESMND